MPNKQAAMKDLRKSKKRTVENANTKRSIQFLLKQVAKAIETGDKATALDGAKKIQKALDKATKNNVIKKNTANRKKSRIMNKVNAIA